MRHFIYQHLPAGGLGYRSPRRPYVTGGLGRVVVLVVIDDFITGDLETIYLVEGPLGQFWQSQYPFLKWEALPQEGFFLVGELTNQTYYPPFRAFPYSDFFNIGWSDETYGNDNGIYWDELNHQGAYLDVTIFGGVGIPEDPLPVSATYAGELTIDDPGTKEDHYVTFRARGIRENPVGFGVVAQVVLYTNSGTTIVKHWTGVENQQTGWVTFKLPLTSAEAAIITDYSDLRVVILVELAGADGPYTVELDWIALEVPVAGKLETPTQVEDQTWSIESKHEFINIYSADKLVMVALLHTKWQANNVELKLFTSEASEKWHIGRLF